MISAWLTGEHNGLDANDPRLPLGLPNTDASDINVAELIPLHFVGVVILLQLPLLPFELRLLKNEKPLLFESGVCGDFSL